MFHNQDPRPLGELANVEIWRALLSPSLLFGPNLMLVAERLQ